VADRDGREVFMTRIHAPEYHELAVYYDLLNETFIPYRAQCEFVEGLLARHDRLGQRILDLGCGTGTHALYFARSGSRVVGIDLSIEMLELARSKAAEAGLSDDQVTFLRRDMRQLDWDQEFDLALGLNYAVTLCLEHGDIVRFLQSVYDALSPGGLLILDFLSHYDESGPVSIESVEAGDVRIECIREFEYDRARQVLDERMTYYVDGDGAIRRYEGYQAWRIFYPQELIGYLERVAGFRVLGLHTRWDLDKAPTGPDWAIVAERPLVPRRQPHAR